MTFSIGFMTLHQVNVCVSDEEPIWNPDEKCVFHRLSPSVGKEKNKHFFPTSFVHIVFMCFSFVFILFYFFLGTSGGLR